MKLRACCLTVVLLGLPALALAQGYGDGADQSIIRQTGYGWRNHVTVADGCGCTVPVRADCYDQPCCFRCGLRPLCFLQRVHRMLDCLLPCKKCYCGPFGGCLLGGRCGGCGGCGSCNSCCGPACGGGCSCSSALPGFSDPFTDDPVPPRPIADPGTEVRSIPRQRAMPVPAVRNSPTANNSSPRSPWKVAGNVAHAAMPSSKVGSTMRVVARPATPKPKLIPPQEQSVLRRASAEEPAPLPIAPESAQPIIRSQSPETASDDAIPHNPLRSR
jgi:hypothetical protein